MKGLNKNKLARVVKSFHEFKQGEYLAHLQVLNTIMSSSTIDNSEDLGRYTNVADTLDDEYIALQLDDVSQFLNDSFKAPEAKVQLIYEIFWR